MGILAVGADVVWAPVIAALGASILTIVGVLARDAWADRRQRKAHRLAAYEALLAQSMSVAQAAFALRLTMKVRSGLKEGVDIAFRQRKPIDPFDLTDRLRAVFQPLFVAQATVWATGSSESIPLANDLVDKCLALLGLATEGGEEGGKVERHVFGERWTPEQEQAYLKAATAVGDARRSLADLVRREGRAEPVDIPA